MCSLNLITETFAPNLIYLIYSICFPVFVSIFLETDLLNGAIGGAGYSTVHDALEPEPPVGTMNTYRNRSDAAAAGAVGGMETVRAGQGRRRFYDLPPQESSSSLNGKQFVKLRCLN